MKMEKQSFKEKILLAKSQKGDDTVFWELWNTYQSQVLQKCNQMLRNDPVTAEVVYTEVMFKVLKILPDHANRITSFRSWILRITENLCIDEIRKAHRHIKLHDLDTSNKSADLGLYDSPMIEHSIPDSEDQINFLLKRIRELPKKYRYVLLFRCCFEKSYMEIALFFQITYDTCRKRFEIAKKLLKKSLAGHGDSIINILLNDPLALRKSRIWFLIQNEITIVEKNRKIEIYYPYQYVKIIPRRQLSGLNRYTHFFYDGTLNQKRTKIETLKTYIIKHPMGWRKRLDLAQLLLINGEWNRAMIELNTLISLYPGNIEARLLLCFIHLENNMPSKAAQIFQDTKSYVLNKASKYYLKGMIHFCNSRYEKAATDFNFASMLEQYNPVFPMMEAMAHLRSNRINATRFALEQTLRLKPDHLEATIIYNDILIFLGFRKKAEIVLNENKLQRQNDPIGIKNLVKYRCRKLLLYKHEGVITRSLIKQLQKKTCSIPMSLEVQIYYNFYRGEWKRVLEYLKSIPPGPDNIFLLIKWYYYLGDTKKSRSLILDFLSSFDNSPPKLLLLASEVFRTNLDFSHSDRILRHLLEHYEMNIDLQVRFLRSVLKDPTKFSFIRHYTFQLLRQHQDLPELYFIYAQVLLEKGDYTKAQRFLIRGWQLLKDDEASYFSFQGAKLLSKCFSFLGDKEQQKLWHFQAKLLVSEIISHFPALGFYQKGLLAIDQNQIASATRAFRLALNNQLKFPERQFAINFLKGKTR